MLKFIIKLPLSVNILIGLCLGIITGIISIHTNSEPFIHNWIQPWGEIFLNLLKLMAMPIVFLSIVCGIFGIGNLKDFSHLAGRTFLLYILTTVFAIIIGLILATSIRPGSVFSAKEQHELNEQFGETAIQPQISADEMKSKSPLQFLVDIVPDNLIKAVSDNTKMLQIIFLAILLGMAILLIPDEKTTVIRQFFMQLNNVFIHLVELIIKTAPFGVFSLMAGMLVDFGGSTEILQALGMYSLTVISGLLFIVLVFYPLIIRFFTKISPLKFLKGIFPAQIVAFTTSSSAVTLPVTRRQVETELGVPPKISGFVLPLGMTINMDGTSLYQVIAVLFISQVFGIELTFAQQMYIILLALLSSIGAPGIPGGSIVMLVFILSSVGIPVKGLALILGVDRPLDMLRTAINITGDSMICCLLKDKISR